MLLRPVRGICWDNAVCLSIRSFRQKERCFSSAIAEAEKSRDSSKKAKNKLFDDEKKRQSGLIARIEKIEVVVRDVKPEPSEVTLIMNKEMSTPYNCAQHIHERYTKQSVVAELDNGQLWDMHRPIRTDTTLKFRNFRDENPHLVNQVFWRSCSFLLGMVVETAFKDSVPVVRHSWPKPNIKSGSFLYDVSMPSLSNWNATDAELRTLTSVLWKIKERATRFERLDVKPDIARDIFSGNPFKISQIDNMVKSQDKISLYRLEDHIDMSVGPMIADLSFIGRANFAAVHKIKSPDGPLYRFQGIAIPDQISMAHYAYQVIWERAKQLNVSDL
ncbi:39S ribosomal protein L39, mitochondrial [Halotydeus destructor]|nr:39S ribosomal protein L39, mitochondrial [Halotydeus destructor]